MNVSPTDIGIWVVCAFVIVEGLYHGKQLFFSGSKKEPSSYKHQYVTREELNGKLEDMKESIGRLIEKIDELGLEVVALKTVVKSKNRHYGM